MSQINAFTGAVAQSSQVQQQQGAAKERQIRRSQNLAKNTALQGDKFEHQVESADATHGVQDRPDSFQSQQRPRQPKKKPAPKSAASDKAPRIDLKV